MGVLAALVALAVGACGGINPAPSGSTRLRILTDSFALGRPCGMVAATPLSVGHSGDSVVFTELGTGSVRTLIWPSGFSAWLVDGKAVLYDSSGTVIGEEGQELDSLGGGSDSNGFHVCAIGARNY